MKGVFSENALCTSAVLEQCVAVVSWFTLLALRPKSVMQAA